jgi:excisionase family DNA binding protein
LKQAVSTRRVMNRKGDPVRRRRVEEPGLAYDADNPSETRGSGARRNRKRNLVLTWEDAPDILTVEEAAVLARVPRNAMYEAVRLRVVPSVNFGCRRTRISKHELAKVFASAVEVLLPTAAFSLSEA